MCQRRNRVKILALLMKNTEKGKHLTAKSGLVCNNTSAEPRHGRGIEGVG